MAEKNIDVRMRFLDDFSKGFKSSMDLMTKGTKSAEKAWGGIQKAGDSIAKVGKNLTAAVTTPLVGVGVAATKNFAEVDKQIRLVEATMGDAAWATGDLTGAMKTAAANSVFTMSEAADASLNFARQGFNAKQASDMLTPAMSLAAGTATDLASVTGGLGNALKMFGLESDQAAKTADILAKAQASANTTTQDLFDSMTQAGPIAASVGWSVSDLATVTATLGNAGISGAEGGTALKTGLARLASPAKDARIWFNKLGLEIFDANGQMKSAADIQGQLHESFKKLSDSEKLSAASAIFGKNQMSKWMALIQASPSDFKTLQSAIDNSSGSADSMANSLMSGVGGSLEKLKSTWDVVKYDVGDTVGTVVKPLIDKVTDGLTAFSKMDDAQKKNIVRMLAMAAAVGPVVLGIGKLVTTIGSIGTKFTKFAEFSKKVAGGAKAFKKLSSGAKLLKPAIAALTSPLGIVLGIIALLAVAFIACKTHMAAFKEGMKAANPAVKSIKADLAALKAQLDPYIPTIKKIVAVVKEVVASVLVATVTSVFTIIANVIDTFLKVLSNVINVVKGVIKVVVALIHGDWKGAWEAAKDIVENIFGAIKNIVDGFINVIDGIGGAFKGVFSKIKLPKFSHGGTIPAKAVGDSSWAGGLVQVHERGGEIMDLPGGTRIYPHDESLAKAYQAGAGSRSITIPKLADQIVVKEQADIDRITDMLVRKIEDAEDNYVPAY